MGKDHDPWHQLPHSPWGFGTLNCGDNLGPPTTAQENTNSMGFPAYLDPFGAATFSVNGAAPFPLYHNPMIAAFGLQEITSSQRKFMAFDQSRNQTSLICTSAAAPLMNSQGAANPLYMDLQGSNETNVTDGNGVEEMHEDTEEIDALLYSDSEDYVDEEEAKEEEEEEASTGHSPVIVSKERSIEEVASSKTLPTKKRRLDSELDASLVDTASSARVYYSKNDGDVESRFAGAGEKREEAGDEKEKEEEEEVEEEEEEEEEISNEPSYYPNKRIKRERIRETVGLLRRIIPGGKSKDAATILDEAISYLKSLKLKTMAFGAASATTSAL